jgi:hypothetical protein
MSEKDRWKGTVMDNSQVASTIRKYGTPAHSKPHGPGKTILYYEDPAWAEGGSDEKVVDFAGTPTPGTRTLVTHQPLPGSVEASSRVSAKSNITGPGGPTASVAQLSAYGSVSDTLADAPIEGDVDQDILDQEADAREARANLGRRDTVAGEGRQQVNLENSTPGATPHLGAGLGGPSLGAAKIGFLDDAQRDTIRQGLKSDDPETRALAAQNVDEALEMIPRPPSSTSTSSAASDESGGLGMGGSEASNTAETPALEDAGEGDESDALETPDETPAAKTPRDRMKEAHPEWTYAFLDAKTKAELEDLADEAEKAGVTVAREDGKPGEIRKSDYVAALRTDQ